jgi:hypothetical protein
VGAANHRDQVGIVCRTLREDEDEPRVPLSVIADFFGIGKESVHWQAERYRDVVRSNDPSRTLPHEAYQYITEIVQSQFAD